VANKCELHQISRSNSQKLNMREVKQGTNKMKRKKELSKKHFTGNQPLSRFEERR
jgi:hypothetical protein